MPSCLRHGTASGPPIANAGLTASNSSRHLPFVHARQQARFEAARDVRCSAQVSLDDISKETGAGPPLSSLNKLDLSSAMMLANLMKPPQEQYTGPATADDDQDDFLPDGTERPNDPVKVADFVQALEVIVRSSNNEINHEQLNDIFKEVCKQQLVPTFTPKQLGVTLKNLAIIGPAIPTELLGAFVSEIEQQMPAFDIAQLSNVNWALVRLLPVPDQQARHLVCMDPQWIQRYHAACEQQLQQVAQQQVAVPTAQQLANLLLVPTAVAQPFTTECQQLFEAAVVMAQRRLCGMAAAQIFTCYLGLHVKPGQAMLDVLLQHLEEDHLLYDYDELTQVVLGVCQLDLKLPSKVLADLTQRCDMLEASQQADPQDVQVMKECMNRLAKAALVAA